MFGRCTNVTNRAESDAIGGLRIHTYASTGRCEQSLTVPGGSGGGSGERKEIERFPSLRRRCRMHARPPPTTKKKKKQEPENAAIGGAHTPQGAKGPASTASTSPRYTAVANVLRGFVHQTAINDWGGVRGITSLSRKARATRTMRTYKYQVPKPIGFVVPGRVVPLRR